MGDTERPSQRVLIGVNLHPRGDLNNSIATAPPRNWKPV